MSALNRVASLCRIALLAPLYGAMWVCMKMLGKKKRPKAPPG